MSAAKEDIESIVIPNFIHEPIETIEWGEWKPAGPEEEIIEAKINGKDYLLVETHDYVPSGNPADWNDDFWTKDDIKSAGYNLSSALQSKKPVKLERWESDYVIRLEDVNQSFVDYYLFSK